MYVLHYLSALPLFAGTYAATTSFCKRDPSSPQWPSIQQWQALNTSVSGALRAPTAPGAVCHPDQPNFNNATCTALQGNWTKTEWVAQNPWVADYNDETCLPSSMAPCSTAGYPAYVIEANTENDIVAGVQFAKQNQVRLIVKGTGHDFPGRSSGPGSLSIWTHKLQGVEVTMEDTKAVQYGGVAAVKIHAGMRWGEIYEVAAKNNITVIGGADPHVGIGGWITAGGHSPLSAKYGMGSDQVLEMDVVTADGQILTINETSNADLFWAMRGGGGSTFAVLLSVTVKAYPTLAFSSYGFSYNTTVASDTYWSLVAHFHADLPRISEAGGMGYYFVVPYGGSKSVVTGGWFFPGQSEDYASAVMEPFEQMLNNSQSWAVDQISVDRQLNTVEDFSVMWPIISPPADAGGSARLGSWLLDGPALTSNVEHSAAVFRNITPEPYSVLGHLVAGPGTRNAIIPGGSSAVLPAWRKAYTHVITPRAWTPLNATQKNLATQDLRENVIPTLKSLAPDSGAYMNEADPSNPNWKNDYYGSNYERLLQIKNTWDPDGIFWCKPCVGHDQWEVLNGPAEEDQANWGIAQVGGQICKGS